MLTAPSQVRIAAVAAPVLLLLYGMLRLVDGLDGSYGPGIAWDMGHTLFFVAFLFFGILLLGLGMFSAVATVRARLLAYPAMVAGLFGVACFLWVILGDLFPGLGDTAPLPEPLEMIGPLLFQLGLLTLLIMMVAARPRRLAAWSPPLVFVGFLLIAANLDLLPVGALLVLAGLAPLAGIRCRRFAERPPMPSRRS